MFAGLSGALAQAPQRQRDHDAVIALLCGALAQGPYVMGVEFMGADLLIGSALGFGRRAFPADEVLDDYVVRCRARPAAIRSLARNDQSGLQVAA